MELALIVIPAPFQKAPFMRHINHAGIIGEGSNLIFLIITIHLLIADLTVTERSLCYLRTFSSCYAIFIICLLQVYAEFDIKGSHYGGGREP